jgi:SAM-dependent methyltransferase
MSEGTAVPVCPSCGATTARLAYGLLRPVLECRSCGLLFEATAGETAHLYDDAYFAGGGYADYKSGEPQWRRESRIRLRWVRRYARGRRLLEVGAAAGFFLDEARRAGFDTLGVEVAAGMAAFAREELGLEVLEAEFEQADLPRATFDVVCAWHVLEHVADPNGFLAKAAEVLAPEGILALEVPNVAGRTARRAGVAWDCLQPGYHRLHFSPSSLSSLLGRGGFEPLVLETLWQAAYLPWRRRFSPPLLARRAARALELRHVELTHPTQGDFVRAIARVAHKPSP